MAEETRILSLNDKIQLLAQDMYDTAHLKNSLNLDHYVPSKQLQGLLDEDEFLNLIAYLRKHDILSFSFRKGSVGTRNRNIAANGFRPHAIIINQPKIRSLLGLRPNAAQPNKSKERGATLHHKYSCLIINGIEIPLARGKLHKTLQYWICRLCLQKPNTPIQETSIMAKYATDYEITGRNRAVRDAVYKLNPKIKNATGISELFTYSNGYVVFNADKLQK